jgi:hypothetical protein
MEAHMRILSLLAAAALAAPSQPRPIAAAFTARSYRPGDTARLSLWTGPLEATLQLFRAGPEGVRTRANDMMNGVAVSRPVRVRLARPLDVLIGTWPSGLYFARLNAPGGRVGYAPFVLRPGRLGASRIAVVLPTNTWQAYNFRDGGTWYADPHVQSVNLARPFLDRGVPPHFRGYDLGFVRWLARTGRRPDVLSDDDLELVSRGDRLARLYDLVVFSGHEEYVTGHVYDVVERYRDLGGNLAFLSANTFFYRVERRGHRLFRTGRWRDLGRHEATLTGAEYLGWNQGRYPNAPYVVTGARRAPWLFGGTGLRDGDRFGRNGIEIDARTRLSPHGTLVLARVPGVFGPGRSAEMTYYETASGAKVFAAGTLNFGGSAMWPVVSRLLDNLWARLARP